MKKELLFLLFFSFYMSYSQSFDSYWNELDRAYSKGFNHKNYFYLVNEVKEIEEINENTIKVGSVYDIISTKHKREFNRYGYLLKEYLVQKDGSLFLTKENTFDNKNNLLLGINYSNRVKRKRINDSIVFVNYINSYREKFAYNDKGQLLTKHQKTSSKKEYYISIRNTYKDGNLIKSEGLNNHIETSINGYISCKADGYSLNDFITEYTYNTKLGKVATAKRYMDTSVRYRDTIIDKTEHQIPVIREDDNFDFSSLKLENEYSFAYDQKGNRISQKISDYRRDIVTHREIHYQYDDTNRVIEELNTYSNGRVFGNWFEYLFEDGILKEKRKGYIKSKKANEERKTSLSSIAKYNKDGSFQVISYNNNKIEKFSYYNSHEHLFERSEINGHNIVINYKYDDKGNFIEKITLNNGVVSEKITRKISYY